MLTNAIPKYLLLLPKIQFSLLIGAKLEITSVCKKKYYKNFFTLTLYAAKNVIYEYNYSLKMAILQIKAQYIH